MTTQRYMPQLSDDSWIASIREEYPEDTEGYSDEYVRDKYANGCKYVDTWDHLGDARQEYEELADAYLELLKFVEGIQPSSNTIG